MRQAQAVTVPTDAQAFCTNYRSCFDELITIGVLLLQQDPRNLRRFEVFLILVTHRLNALILQEVLNHTDVKDSVKMHADKILASEPGNYRVANSSAVKIVLPGNQSIVVQSRYVHNRAPSGSASHLKRGFYPELAVLGIIDRTSPGLLDEVSRLSVLMPSFQHTRDELERRGTKLDIKTITRLTYCSGQHLLSSRQQKLLAWRRGELPEGNELAGKRVVISIDGGKARTRKKKRGPRGKGKRPRFDTPWREPRLVIIYTVDENGRSDTRKFKPVVETTLYGADALMELVAMRLFELGAGKAKQIAFISDGAEWIWERINNTLMLAGIAPVRCHMLLDPYHAIEHINEALKLVVRLCPRTKKRHLKRLRKYWIHGKAQLVIEELSSYLRGRNSVAIGRHVAYLERHWEKGRTSYPEAKGLGMPIGSGAVESAIRRIINLRLKAPGTFWLEDNLEKMAVMRASLLTGRWDECIERIIMNNQTTHDENNWKWDSPNMRELQPCAVQITGTKKVTMRYSVS